ncbi:MAG: hypothetical protein M3010_12815 [Candidatus Dormibacteraeota bacterium]|nr:hypothetical protein [Candidatus Dormibacteraeota bacterium]
MMGSVSIGPNRHISGEKWAAGAWEDPRRAADAGMRGMELFRADPLAAHDELATLTSQLAVAGYPMSAVRALQLAIWTEVEPQDYYRQDLVPDAGPVASSGAIRDAPVGHRP